VTDDYRLVAVDLFCGGGGFTTGFVESVVDRFRETIAAETGLAPDAVHREHVRVQVWLDENIKLVAVNHWDPAVETYRANHPYAEVHNAKVQALHPPDAVDGYRVDVLIAGPSCVPHSPAKGGMADNDQKRMGPRHVAHWLELLRPDQFILENVPGFRNWGPLEWNEEDEEYQMIKDGSLFEDWIGTLKKLGYTVDHETFVAADYGDPQSRKRLFVMGRLNYQPAYPDPTHSPRGEVPGTKPHRTAADVIDWSDPGGSIWTRDLNDGRKTPPKNTTMQRIAEGIRRHCDDHLEPFAAVLDRIGNGNEDDPVAYTVQGLRERVVPAEYAGIVAEATDDPFLVALPNGGAVLTGAYLLGQHSNAKLRDAHARPTPTVATAGSIGKIEVDVHRSLVKPRNGLQGDLHSNGVYPPTERPLHTITAKNNDGHLLTPSLIRWSFGGATLPIDRPMPTIATERGGVFAYSDPYLVKFYGTSHCRPLSAPVDTVTSGGQHFGLSNPYLCPLNSERAGQRPRTRSVDRPLMTVPASKSPAPLAWPVAWSFVDDYEGPAKDPASVPLGTVTTRDRFALCIPEVYPWGLDIRYRMLKPRELARAQGFPDSYEFTPTAKSKTTELIGNAVPVNMAKALCGELLEPTDEPTLNHYGDGPQPVADGLKPSDARAGGDD